MLARKSLDTILAEMEGARIGCERALGPVQLTALGIGAVIGAGIFVATGAAAKDVAGPALMVSYLTAGRHLHFRRALLRRICLDGARRRHAYTYAYTTLGELFAWIIGWDLVLEYAVGAATVANGWSSYSQSVLLKVGIVLPMVLTAQPTNTIKATFCITRLPATTDKRSRKSRCMKEASGRAGNQAS